jgi:hypothetical protein
MLVVRSNTIAAIRAGELALKSNVPDVGPEIFRAYCNILDRLIHF